MSASPTTKKFVKALTAKGMASSRSAFVVPAIDGSREFVELQNGKRHDAAYLVYIGRSITAEDVLQRLSSQVQDLERARRLINSLLNELQRFKVGNVVAIEQSNGEQVQLRLVATTPKPGPRPKLPG